MLKSEWEPESHHLGMRRATDTHSATVTNTTLDDRSPEIKFTGQWTPQTGPNFFNQTSTYTEGPNNAFEVNFTGMSLGTVANF